MKKGMLILAMTFTLMLAMAQVSDIRVPVKLAMKFGVVDGNEVEIVPPIYENVAIYSEYKLILLNKNGMWGVFDWHGKMIVDYVISASAHGSLDFPDVSRVKNANYEYGKFATSNLLTIHDKYANVRYYINPNHRQSSYTAYGGTNLYAPQYNLQNVDFAQIDNLFRVVNRDQSITFIDSTGVSLFDASFEDGQIVNPKLIALKKEGKYALFNGKKQLTPFEFENSPWLAGSNTFYLYKKIKKADNQTTNRYYIFLADGTVLDSTSSTPNMDIAFVLVNYFPGFSLYDQLGKKLFSNPELTGSFIHLGKNTFIKTESKKGSGLMTLNGEEIYKPECVVNNNYSHRSVSVTCGQSSMVLDSLLKPIFSMDSVASLYPSQHADWFIYSVNKSWDIKMGLIRKDKKVIEKPLWYRLAVADCDSLFLVELDTINQVKKVGRDEPLVLLPDPWRLTVNCKAKLIEAFDGKETYQLFDFEGKLVKKWNQKDVWDESRYGKHKYRVKEEGKQFFITDKKGVPVLKNVFQNITPIYDDKKGESVYICQTAKNTHPSAVVYNDQLKVITPVGYSIPADWYRYMDENPGTLCVVNDADVVKNKYSFRFGICDYSGKWIVPPFVGTFKYIDPGLFILHYYEEKKIKFYDNTGNRTCDDDFLMIEKGNGSDFFQNRILVGNVKDPEYMKKVEALNLEKLEMEVAVEKLKALGEPEMEYGYLNKRGKKVLDLKYRKAQPFPMSGITTTVAVEKNGMLISQVIDTSGTVLFEGEFEEMELIDSMYFKVQKEGKWALATHQGVVLTPYQFDEIYFESRGKYFNAKGGDERFIISMDYKILNLGKYYNALTQKFNDSYVVKLISQEAGSFKTTDKYVIYDKDFVKKAEILDAKDIGGEYNNLPLPPGYVLVKRDYMGKDVYLFDVNRNKSLWK